MGLYRVGWAKISEWVAIAIIGTVFIQTDPDPRKALYKLRTTWTPFLPNNGLAAIDKHVHAMDPNWPVTAVDKVVSPPVTTIFINPKFVGVCCYSLCV